MKTSGFWRSPYAWFWFHVEALWIKDTAARRPFTYIIRDFYHAHPILWTWLAVLLGYSLGFWLVSFDSFIKISLGILMGHLFWGKGWLKGEQERPPYPPGGA